MSIHLTPEWFIGKNPPFPFRVNRSSESVKDFI
jgi:hypothetical protein